MSAGEAVVWCFAIVGATILFALLIVAWAYKSKEKNDTPSSQSDKEHGIWMKTTSQE